MAVWENAIITNKGLALLAKLASGNALSLVRAVAGAGRVEPVELKYMTAVMEEKQELSFATQSYPEEGKCAVPVKLSNSGVSVSYAVHQIGIYAFDPDEGEILFMISQETSGTGTEIPAAIKTPGFSAAWTFYLQYGQADGVEVTVDPANAVTAGEVQALIAEHNQDNEPHAGVLAKKTDLTHHVVNQKNPHGVTKDQVGLGNVDNTADSEKNVAFASRAKSADKVKYSIIIRFNGGRTEGTDQWTYDGNTSRSINITPEKIGALPAGGGTMTGPLNLTENVHYGDTLPTNPAIGRLYFLDEDAADALGV